MRPPSPALRRRLAVLPSPRTRGEGAPRRVERAIASGDREEQRQKVAELIELLGRTER